MSVCQIRHESESTACGAARKTNCCVTTLKARVDAIVDDLSRRRVDLSKVTLEEMKCYLTAALRHCEKTAATKRQRPACRGK